MSYKCKGNESEERCSVRDTRSPGRISWSSPKHVFIQKKNQLTFKTNPEIREGVHLLIPTFKLSHPSHSILELWH